MTTRPGTDRATTTPTTPPNQTTPTQVTNEELTIDDLDQVAGGGFFDSIKAPPKAVGGTIGLTP